MTLVQTQENFVKRLIDNTTQNCAKRSNILTPLVWPLSILMAGIVSGPVEVRDTLVTLFIIACVLYGLGYLYWSFVDPSKLQTEKHIQSMRAIEMFHSSGLASLADSQQSVASVQPSGNVPGIFSNNP